MGMIFKSKVKSNKATLFHISRHLFLTLCFCAFAVNVQSQTTEFTYQGSLKNSGLAANGNFDFEFALFDAVTNGNQVGSTVALNNVAVANGIFAVKLDFGNQFTGASRFLEIRVRVAGQPGITTLGPRQLMNSSPYSVKSLNSTTADTATDTTQLGGVAANQYVVTTDPRMTDARPPTAGSSNYIQNTTSPQSSSNFNISGDGTVSGTSSGNIVNALTQFNLGGQRIVAVTGTSPNFNTVFGFGAGATNIGSMNSFFGLNAGANTTSGQNSFFGGSAGEFNTTGSNNSFFGLSAGRGNTTASNNSFFGTNAGFPNTTGINNSFFGSGVGSANSSGGNNTFFGFVAGNTNTVGSGNTIIGSNADVSVNNLTNAAAIGANAQVTQSNSLILGSINGINTATADTNVGIGTTAPTERLHVVGNGLFTGNLTVNGALNATLPAGSSNYIQNQNAAAQASSNFNISGNGTVSGTLQANIVRAGSQFNIGSDRVLRANNCEDNTFLGIGAGEVNIGCAAGGNHNSFFGANSGKANTGSVGNQHNSFFGANSGLVNTLGFQNSFFGSDSGLATTTGDGNSFFGYLSGDANTTGNRNTLIGNTADVGANNLVNATAIGANAQVDQSNSLILGSINGVNGATSNTRVGIGTTTPAKELHILGAGDQEIAIESSDTGGIRWTLQSSAGASNGSFQIIDRTAGVSRITILDDGSVGIGTTAPTDRLHVNGTLRVNTLGGAGSTALCRNVFNQIATCSSSLRYKTNIGQFSQGMSFVRQLRPITFDWKDGGMKDVGFGAEDVAKIDPRFVTYNNKGEVEGVKYDRLSVAFVNAFKEQQNEISSQRSVIENLNLKIENQQSKIDTLTQIVCSLKPDADGCKQEEK